MLAPRYIPLVLKQVIRHPTRTMLTALGVAAAMFLFTSVQAVQHAVTEATGITGRETTLVVYRRNRFCPFTSRLPESYASRIARVPGVASVMPMKIVVNNCGASLDTVTFRGIRPGDAETMSRSFEFLSGSLDEWRRRADAALVGESLAARRAVKAGDTLAAAGITAYVAGVVRSAAVQDQNAAYVGLAFLQRAAIRGGDGIVTQFNVTVTDPAQLDHIAAAIDDEFRHDAEPTDTRAEKAFVARAAHDLVQIVGFTRYLGWAALAAVLALVANAIILSVQDRIKEHAIMQTIGFRSSLIARLIIGESLVLGLVGGALGASAALIVMAVAHIALSVEGTSIIVNAQPASLASGLAISMGVGTLAGFVPALQVSRREIAACFRAV